MSMNVIGDLAQFVTGSNISDLGNNLIVGYKFYVFIGLISLGFNRISAIERPYGIIEVIKEYNLPYTPPGYLYLDPLNKTSYKQLDQFFPLAGKNCVFFCTSDQFAFSVIGYLTRHGFLIPDDFSVCGFDDNIYAGFSIPQLTTVHQDIRAKAQIALDILLQLINGKQLEDSVTYLPVSIITRSSTKNYSAPNRNKDL